MFQRLKTLTLIASVVIIPLSLGGCRSKGTAAVSSAPPATAKQDDQFYKPGRVRIADRPKLLPIGPSRPINSSQYDNSASFTGPNLPLPAPPTED